MSDPIGDAGNEDTDARTGPAGLRTLTLNEVAVAIVGCRFGAKWWEARGRSKFCKVERANFTSLAKKLSRIMDDHEPPRDEDGEVPDFGDITLVLSKRSTTKTKRPIPLVGCLPR